MLKPGSKPFTDGTKIKYFVPGEEPEGWYPGNSGNNKAWYNNGIENKRFQEGHQPEGWVKGCTEEWKAKNSAAQKKYNKEHPDAHTGDKNSMFGRPGKKGSENPATRPEVREKISNSCKGRTAWNRGIPRTEEQKQHQSNVMMGRERTEETKEKWRKTLKENFKFNTSSDEETLYKELCAKYSRVIRQYSDERFPFACDFYIPEEDLFIDLNKHWTHGKHPFDETNTDDLQLVETWKNKNKKYYNNAIYVWTDLDVRKLRIAKQNNLNYITLY